MAAKKHTAPKPGTWTIMVHIVGESSLSGSMISQLKELTDAGFQKDTTVLAFFDPNCNGTGARIFNVNHHRKKKSPQQTVIGDGRDPFVRDIAEDCWIPNLPQIPSLLSLRYFLAYARTEHRSENYMLFLMGHGVVVGSDAFLPDPEDNSAITLSDLGWVLKDFGKKVGRDGSKFQLVGFHSCSMSSVELIHELAGSAQYMMGTQGSALPGSWPYRQILKKFFLTLERARNRQWSTDTAFEKILRSLQDLSFYNSEDYWMAGYSADLSICSLDPTKVNLLKGAIQQLARALSKGLKDTVTQNCIQLAHLRSQSYWGENYTDLSDLCECLLKECEESPGPRVDIRTACDNLIGLLKSGPGQLIRYSDYYGPQYQFSNGLSIYFPWVAPEPEIASNYENYKFTKDKDKDSWWSFLQLYFSQTKRDLRGSSFKRPTKKLTRNNIWATTLRSNWLRAISDRNLLKLGGEPGKVLGDDPGKVLGDPGKVLGDPGKVLGDPGKVLGDPGKVLGDPGKVLGLYAVTVIKNFTDPEGQFVTSREKTFEDERQRKKEKPRRGNPNR